MGRPGLSAAVDKIFEVRPGPAAAGFQIQNASAAMFLRHVNSTFLVRSETGAPALLRLASVSERPLAAHIEQFSLIFHAPDEAVDLHGTRAFEHRTLGSFEAFIVPIGVTSVRPRVYEACFSRSVSAHG